MLATYAFGFFLERAKMSNSKATKVETNTIFHF